MIRASLHFVIALIFLVTISAILVAWDSSPAYATTDTGGNGNGPSLTSNQDNNNGQKHASKEESEEEESEEEESEDEPKEKKNKKVEESEEEESEEE